MKKTPSKYSRMNKLKIVVVVSVWVLMSGLFFTGTLKMDLIGHIEISSVVAFSVVLLGLHLFTIIKKEANHTLHF